MKGIYWQYINIYINIYIVWLNSIYTVKYIALCPQEHPIGPSLGTPSGEGPYIPHLVIIRIQCTILCRVHCQSWQSLLSDLHYTTVQYNTVQYSTLHYTTQHYTTLHCSTLQCRVHWQSTLAEYIGRPGRASSPHCTPPHRAGTGSRGRGGSGGLMY